ncbi:MAG TPA: four helix bundle protein [Chitinophagaceae bacterium]|nr:four helix bundle protein [Chitinophagaceae bacterium]HUM65400.1 four helix bundle protein [Chitinophagaceae bacterium]
MFLELSHTKLDVFIVSKAFVFDCYRQTNSFPPAEKFGMISQIRRAALSVHLNIAEGCSRKSLKERKRFYEISRGSLIEVDAALDIAVDLGYATKQGLETAGMLMVRIFQLVSRMISYDRET